MTEGGYTRDEILKGERIILQVRPQLPSLDTSTDRAPQSLEFNISPYCSPYSWVRRISKADDYDIQTRTLSKFLMEVTLLDHRFLRAKPSMIAAIGMFLARKMLGGEWVRSSLPSSVARSLMLVPPQERVLRVLLQLHRGSAHRPHWLPPRVDRRPRV
jgi:hypothetical protein